jgi:hypothetical protein
MAVVVSTNEPPSGGWVSLLTRTSDHGLNNWLYKRLHILLISWLRGFFAAQPGAAVGVGVIVEIAHVPRCQGRAGRRLNARWTDEKVVG